MISIRNAAHFLGEEQTHPTSYRLSSCSYFVATHPPQKSKLQPFHQVHTDTFTSAWWLVRFKPPVPAAKTPSPKHRQRTGRTRDRTWAIPALEDGMRLGWWPLKLGSMLSSWELSSHIVWVVHAFSHPLPNFRDHSRTKNHDISRPLRGQVWGVFENSFQVHMISINPKTNHLS